MKKILAIAAIAISTCMTAQTDKKEQQTITIQDGIEIPVKVKSYKATLALGLQDARYSDPNAYESFDNMKEILLEKAAKKGIKASQLVERKVEYYTSGYRGEGTIFQLISSNEEEIANFLSISIPGATPRSIEYKLSYDETSFTNNIAEKMSKMKEKAQLMAKELNLKITKVNQVDLSQSKQSDEWTSYKEIGYVAIGIEYVLE